MLLEKDNTEVVSSGTMKSNSYEIGDVGFILGLLRSKVYSNIIKAITQEYASNARDAHREVGKHDVPIQITLPSNLDLSWKCRDFGPGISPDRIVNIFIRYGNSTKRDSNNQTGGFGIGAKSALGYTDSFIVNTFIDGIKRSYNSVIDETKQGVLTLLFEGPTNEPNGTEIIVPVKSGDINSFITETVKATKHWSPRPNFVGSTPTYPEVAKLVSGSNWFIEKSGQKSFVAILDGIEYPIDTTQVDQSTLPKVGGYIKTYIKFNTGELSVAVNRESLEMTASTKAKLEEGFKIVKTELKEKAIATIQSAPTYLDACIDFKSITGALYCDIAPEEAEWRGQKLIDTSVSIAYHGYATTYSYNQYRNTVEKPKHGTVTSFSLEKDRVYCYTTREFDSKIEPTLKSMFQTIPNAKARGILLVRINSQSVVDKWKFKELGFLNLEDYYVEPVNRKEIFGKLTIFQLVGEMFTRTSMKVFEESANSGNRAYVYLDKEKNPIGFDKIGMVSALADIYKCSVFGFKTSTPELEKKVKALLDSEENLVSLDSLLKEEVANIEKNFNDFQILDSSFSTYESKCSYAELRPYKNTRTLKDPKTFWENFDSLFVNKDSAYLKFIKALRELKKKEDWYSKRRVFANYVFYTLSRNRLYDRHAPEYVNYYKEYIDIQLEMDKQYPLIKAIGNADILEQINYINMVDTLASSGYSLPDLSQHKG
jgi:hypothetical protein